jgi:hypothetical protein
MPPSAALSAAGVPQPPSAASMEFSPQTAQTLVEIFRVMYPHDALDDSYYQAAVRELASRCSTDGAFADLIENGVSRLRDEDHWPQLSGSDRLATLQKIEESPFFQALRTEFLFVFYGDPLVWKFLGYEGPSNELGGYLNRGFDALDWLSAD